MLMKVVIEFMEKELRKALRLRPVSNDCIQYIVNEEWRQTQEELSKLLSEAHAQIEINGQLTVTEETARPFQDFLANRWQRIRKMSPASFLVNPNSAANTCCIGVASWLSDPLGCEALELLIPSLDKNNKPYPVDLSKYILDDAERGFIDVPKCLLNACNDNYNKQLMHTRLIAGDTLVLSENEQYRVINFSKQTSAFYEEMISEKKDKLSKAERELKNSMRYFSMDILAYDNAGKKSLIAHLFTSSDKLVTALSQCPKNEWAHFVSNFDLQDLSLALLQADPDSPCFKHCLQLVLQRNAPNEALLFLLQHLYGEWMEKQTDSYRIYLEEWDVETMSFLCNQDTISSCASQDLTDHGSIAFTPLMRDFYNNINKTHRPYPELICAIKNYAATLEDIARALQTITLHESVWREFAGEFEYDELAMILLEKVPASKYKFIQEFVTALRDDSRYSNDQGYNRAVAYWFDYCYEIWRMMQDNCTTKVPFFRWDLGCEKPYKIAASMLIGKFLASNKTVDDYDKFLDDYLQIVKSENEKKGEGDALKIDPERLKDALKTGTVRKIVNRIKAVVAEEFQSEVKEHSVSFTKAGLGE